MGGVEGHECDLQAPRRQPQGDCRGGAFGLALVIKALKEPPRDRKKVKNISHDGNISWDDVYSVARAVTGRSNAKTLQGTILEVLGTCRGLGCTIDGEDAEDCTEAIHSGEHECPEK